MRKLAVLVCAVTLSLTSAPPVANNGLDSERLARIPARMKYFVDRGEAAGTVNLVARHGHIALLEATGWQDVENKKPMKADSIFQIMSMTKPFTGVAVMMLMEEGKLSLNDPVEKHLPDFKGQMVGELGAGGIRTMKKPSRPITIRDLMTHTSGMSGPHGALSGLYQTMDRTVAEAVPAFAKEPLEFEPGTRWLYSNPGIATLGRLVEVIADQTYDAFVAARILKPLGMKDSFFFPPADKVDRIALLYASKDGRLTRAGAKSLGGDAALYRKGAKYSAPEFGLYSTAPDLFAFYQMLLNGGVANGRRYLSKASIDIMTSPHTADLKAGHLPGTAFGLTWEVVRDPIGTMTLLSPGTFGHGGAFGTHGWVDKQKNMVGVFMIQREGGGGDVKNAVFQMVGSAVVD